MKKKRYYPIAKFSTAFVTEVNERLQNEYTKVLPKEKFFILLSIIERQSSSHPVKELRNLKARLNATILQSILGSFYKQIINILINKGIIETNDSYLAGDKSKDYWIILELKKEIEMKDLIKQEEIVTNDSKLYTRIKKNFYKKSFNKKHHRVYDLLSEIQFDEVAAIKWLANLVISNYFKNDDGSFNQHKHNVYQRMINDMVNKTWVIVEDKKTGRIFHTFNLIKRELRGFCYVGGEKLVQSDLKSSQPYFLASRLINSNGDDINVQKFFKDVTENDIYTVLLNKYIELNGSNKYIEIKLKNIIYPNGSKGIERIEIDKTFDNRDDIKPEFLKVMYKGNKGGATLLQSFKNLYPSVYGIICSLKPSGVKKNEFPILLQKDEADIFIPVFKELSEEVWCLPCHDSLYVAESIKENMLNRLDGMFINNNYNKFSLV